MALDVISSSPTDASQEQQNTWIFQAKESRYRITDSLRLEEEEYWNLNQQAKKVKKGDRVLIWISGKSAGIYAVGQVMTDPEKRSDSLKGQSYWTKPADGKKEKPRVLVRYERLLLDNPLYKRFLEYDPALWNLSIIKFALGTNFTVTQDEWLAIKEWLDVKMMT